MNPYRGREAPEDSSGGNAEAAPLASGSTTRRPDADDADLTFSSEPIPSWVETEALSVVLASACLPVVALLTGSVGTVDAAGPVVAADPADEKSGVESARP